MLKTFDFNNNRYTYDDAVFPDENTKIGDLYLCFDTANPLRVVSAIEYGNEIWYESHNVNDSSKIGQKHWYKIIKVEPIPEIPILKVGTTVYHVFYGEGVITEINHKGRHIVCKSKTNQRWFGSIYNLNGTNLYFNQFQVLSFQPIVLPKFEFKLEPNKVYLKLDNAENLSDAMKRCKLIEHAILLIESGKELFNDWLEIEISNLFSNDKLDLSTLYYYE